MADQTPVMPPLGDEEQEVDLLFRAQIKAQDFLLGHWKHGLALLSALLILVLVFGLVRNARIDAQKAGSAVVAELDRELPDPAASFAGFGEGPTDEELVELAKRYESAAADLSGPAHADAALKAADLYLQADRTDDARRAFEAVSAEHTSGLFSYAGQAGLAALARDSGDYDGAAAIYRTIADSEDGLLAERALFDLGATYEAADRASEARAAYEEVQTRFPASPRLDQVAVALARVGS